MQKGRTERQDERIKGERKEGITEGKRKCND